MIKPLFENDLDRPPFFRDAAPLPSGGTRSRRAHVAAVALAAAGLTQMAAPFNGRAIATASQYVLRVDAEEGLRSARAADMPDGDKLALSWETYLRGLNSILQGGHARAVKRLWADLSRDTDRPVPQAGPGDEGLFTMSWDDGRRYCEIEVYEDGRYEWFYCDRETDDHTSSAGNHRRAVEAVSAYLDSLDLA